MITAERRQPRSARLMTVDPDGAIGHLDRGALASLFEAGDVLVANDAATLPASLSGTLEKDGSLIEVRLAAWVEAGDPTRFVAVVFGAGDHRTRTEDRPPPPPLSAGDRLMLGPLVAAVAGVLDHPRLVLIRFQADRRTVLHGLAHHGRPIQYAHVTELLTLGEMWTAIAAEPVAFEPPSAGFALDWRAIAALRRRGVDVVTLTHAAGISSTGDPALDRRLPFDEPYRIPERTAAAIRRAKRAGGRIVAIGTTVVRALESTADGCEPRAGSGVATGRIERGSRLRVVDAILTGIHRPGESHFELLRAFADDGVLERIAAAAASGHYRAHEFGDSVLIERQLSRNQGVSGPGLVLALTK
jgi:S-adenosylmethionine:tRNA ribosyltransferase-isomerase